MDAVGLNNSSANGVIPVVLKHEHMIIDALVRKANVDSTVIRVLVAELVERIGMKLLVPDGMGPWTNPVASYCSIPGNRGVTCTAIVETSSCVLHAWDECYPHKFHLDVYSCSDLDVEAVFAWMADHFEPISAQGFFLDRDHDRIVVKNEIVKVW